jgi:hypothetical protein
MTTPKPQRGTCKWCEQKTKDPKGTVCEECAKSQRLLDQTNLFTRGDGKRRMKNEFARILGYSAGEMHGPDWESEP